MCFLVSFRPDFTSKLEYRLAFGTPKIYIAPYDKINRGLVNLNHNCDAKLGLRGIFRSEQSIPRPTKQEQWILDVIQ